MNLFNNLLIIFIGKEIDLILDIYNIYIIYDVYIFNLIELNNYIFKFCMEKKNKIYVYWLYNNIYRYIILLYNIN